MRLRLGAAASLAVLLGQMAAAGAATAGEGESAGQDALVEEQMAALHAQLVSCRTMTAPLREGAMEMERKLAECEDELTTCHSDFKHFKANVHLDTNELESLRQRTRLVEDGLSDKEMDILQLKHDNLALRKNVTELIQLGKSYRARNKALRREVDSALKLLDQEKGTNADQSAQLAAKDAELEAARAEADALRETNVAKENKRLAEESEAASDRVRELEAALAAKEAALGAANTQIKDRDAELEERDAELAQARDKIAKLGVSAEALEEEAATLRTERQELKRRLGSAEQQLGETSEQLQELGQAKNSAESKAEELARKREASIEESERLKVLFERYKEKVDDPALVDYFVAKAEWLKHPHVEGVDTAYEKTVKLLGPKLGPTHEALLEMQALLQSSSDRLSGVVGDSETSPMLSGLLTYGILLVPLGVTSCLLVRLKRCISLTKATMLMTLYNAVFSLTMFATSWVVTTEEPLAAFREQNEEAFEFLQIVLPLYYCLYLVFQILLALKFTIAMRCKLSLRAALMIYLPLHVMYRYYEKAWLRAMRDQPPTLQASEWAAYAGVFGLLFVLCTCCNPSQQRDGRSEDNDTTQSLLPLSSPGGARKHGHAVSRARAAKAGNDSGAEVLSPEEVVSSALETAERVKETASELAASLGGGKKSKKSSKKKKKAKSSGSRSSSRASSPSSSSAVGAAAGAGGDVDIAAATTDADDDDDDDDIEDQKLD